jgi:hypothetical protein
VCHRLWNLQRCLPTRIYLAPALLAAACSHSTAALPDVPVSLAFSGDIAALLD